VLKSPKALLNRQYCSQSHSLGKHAQKRAVAKSTLGETLLLVFFSLRLASLCGHFNLLNLLACLALVLLLVIFGFGIFPCLGTKKIWSYYERVMSNVKKIKLLYFE